ncbi:MAG: tryptophan synthase subunit alpha [Actinomycetota bacterium]
MGELETQLRASRDAGRKAFVPYVMGGLPGVDADLLRALVAAGADALEVGIPHSDPVMDGGVIQEASRIALEHEVHPSDVLETIAEARPGVPVVVMTYVNPVYRRGFEAFCRDLSEAGVAGAIVPDLPVDEAEELEREAAVWDLDIVLLAAPGASDARLDAIAAAARGFVYCVATYGVTGAREELDTSSRELVSALRHRTDTPLLVGVGIGTPEHAVEVSSFADGAIVGSAIVARLMEAGPAAAVELAGAFREAIRPRGNPSEGSAP